MIGHSHLVVVTMVSHPLGLWQLGAWAQSHEGTGCGTRVPDSCLLPSLFAFISDLSYIPFIESIQTFCNPSCACFFPLVFKFIAWIILALVRGWEVCWEVCWDVC